MKVGEPVQQLVAEFVQSLNDKGKENRGIVKAALQGHEQ